MTALRIALLTYSTKPRGSVIHTVELAEALHDLGHFVCVYALDKDGSGFHRSLKCDSKLISAAPVTGGIDALIQQRIQEFVDYLKNDLLHTQPYDCYHAQDCIGANALLSLRQQGVLSHFFRTVHHIDQFNSPYLQECQERSIAEPNLCFCVSNVWQAELQKRYKIDAPRVFNGVNSNRFAKVSEDAIASLRQQLKVSGSPVYLTIGGIEPRKNSIRLLQAFADVLSDYPSAQLVIAGGATLFDYQSYRDDFFAQVKSLGVKIGESLILPGVIFDADLPALYHAADAFVFPSVKEGWGLVVLEAIAAGLPVLTANQLPFTEFLTDAQAMLVDPNSSAAIAQAMRQMIQPDTTRSLIHHSQSILPSYTWEKSARKHADEYQKFLTQHSTLNTFLSGAQL
ncbi:MSMEG_0565 family glycosyltransferase [Phormidium sp. CLA17]|uniref:MSMEG_0565 family glycosyltransferase n=1 Tax=Leptolyngbya sp. Cla-17 TaxID=2803751 RepID=UPI001491DB9A|nr:MSMEG_0565 family glycosyltransferase [Leptolyngbya sp. Cla-17]MBM0741524.1 MSMEG_0565 family glycosyltransferase [Leptolyngbya sp. Cla-17]